MLGFAATRELSLVLVVALVARVEFGTERSKFKSWQILVYALKLSHTEKSKDTFDTLRTYTTIISLNIR